jgi:hypothetical protein
MIRAPMKACVADSVEAREEGQRVGHRQQRHLVDAAPGHGHRQRLGPEPRAPAGRARPQRHELLDAVADRHRHRRRVLAPQLRHHALEPPPAAALAPRAEEHALAAARAVEDQGAVPLGQAAPRAVQVDVVLAGDRRQQQVVVVGGAVGPGQHRPLGERALRVDHQLRVDLLPEPEPGAGGARAVGRVEREGARGELGQGGPVLRAGEPLGVGPALRRRVVAAHLLDPHEAVREGGRGLQAVGEAAAQVGAHHEAVDHHLDGVVVAPVERRDLVHRVDGPVDHHPREALGADALEHVAVLALSAPHERREHHEARALGQREDVVGDLLDRLAGDRAAADRAVGLADAREQEAQVVVDLGDGRHRRARVAAGGLLVDRDRRREPLDVVDVRLVHLPEELPRVRRQALHVAPLALGVEGVEGEARLSAPRQAGDHDEVVARDVDRHVAQVVLARPHDADGVGGGAAACGHPVSLVP